MLGDGLGQLDIAATARGLHRGLEAVFCKAGIYFQRGQFTIYIFDNLRRRVVFLNPVQLAGPMEDNHLAVFNGRRRIAGANAPGKNLPRASLGKRIDEAGFLRDIVPGWTEKPWPVICLYREEQERQ